MVSFLSESVFISFSVATSVAIAEFRNAIHVSAEHAIVVGRLRASMNLYTMDRRFMMNRRVFW